jgi:hypothetical protein
MKPQGAVELLDMKKNKYEIQLKLNSFLIWNYKIRWSLYAEVAILSGNIIFVNLRNKKKRKRVEILYNLLKNQMLEGKFEVERLYEIEGEENLKCLRNFGRRKKRRRKDVLVLREKEELFLKEEFC